MQNTTDILNQLKTKFQNNEFRIISGNHTQQRKTVELQNVQFEVDKPWIVREPNKDYFKRELDWYKSQSLNVNDIPGGAPDMWVACASSLGYINSNYGWMIFSKDNYNQYNSCLNKLIEDPHTREACMIYNRPSMQIDYCKDGMHDFCCTYAIQCFLNDTKDNNYELKYIVYMRSNDAIYGFNNDALWHLEVQAMLAKDLSKKLSTTIICAPIIWNCGSLHVYERHFNKLK